MHEAAIIKNLISLLEKEVKDPQVGDVRKIHLEVGELRYIVPEIMELCFRNSTKPEKLNNARLDMKVVPVKVKCSSCERDTVVKMRNFECSYCNGKDLEIFSGKEFNLKGIEW